MQQSAVPRTDLNFDSDSDEESLDRCVYRFTVCTHARVYVHVCACAHDTYAHI